MALRALLANRRSVPGYCATRRLLCYAIDMIAGLEKMTPMTNIEAPNVQRYGGAKRTQQHTGFAQDRDYVHTGAFSIQYSNGTLNAPQHDSQKAREGLQTPRTRSGVRSEAFLNRSRLESFVRHPKRMRSANRSEVQALGFRAITRSVWCFCTSEKAKVHLRILWLDFGGQEYDASEPASSSGGVDASEENGDVTKLSFCRGKQVEEKFWLDNGGADEWQFKWLRVYSAIVLLLSSHTKSYPIGASRGDWKSIGCASKMVELASQYHELVAGMKF
ncbi:hypothetical protein BJ912DRAFT_923103 [Pholiota molesta]|nr:hypothetical protein BJ912DRAFT_923103 [Pholiota molesta]